MAGISQFMRMLIFWKLLQTSEMHVKILEFADSWGCKLSGKFRNYRNLPDSLGNYLIVQVEIISA
jgi:hypothetical protein